MQKLLSPTTLQHFNLQQSPFFNEIKAPTDIYLNESAYYALAVMRDVARNKGFLAVIAESGAGKSVLKKQLMHDLKDDGDVIIIEIKSIDKSKVKPSDICEAIIRDISNESPKQSLEAKEDQVERLLKVATKGKQRHVMIIEEAHDLAVSVVRYLNRLGGVEDGTPKIMGVILIGQMHLQTKLNDILVYLENIFFVTDASLQLEDLTHHISDYLKHKFSRCGGNYTNIMSIGCVEAIKNRLGKKQLISPLTINNLVSSAMNLACELGEQRVTAEIIKEC